MCEAWGWVRVRGSIDRSAHTGRLRAPWAAVVLTLAVAILAGTSLPCRAGDLTGPALIDDAKLYFTAPLRWDERDWLTFGGTLLAIGAAHEYDDNVRAHYTKNSTAPLDGSDPHSTRDAIPTFAIVAATWGVAALLNDHAGYEEGWTMVEAGGFSVISTTLIKLAAARRRPNETTQVDDWFRGGDSFPSRHASLAFAVGTVLAESGGDEYRWLRRALGYGIAVGTAYVRVHDNQHWLSDTVAGAALGIATAQFAMGRREARSPLSSFSVQPAAGGAMLTYTHTFH